MALTFAAQIAFADELASLQADVIVAKQKSSVFAETMDDVSLALEGAEKTPAQSEADALMEKLAKNQPLPASNILPVDPTQPPADRPPTFYQRQELQRPPTDAEAGRKWPWSSIAGIFPKKKTSIVGNRDPYPPDSLISDGDALYRVAVSDGRLSLQEAVDIATANNLQVQAAKKNVEVADAKLTEAKRALYPTVQLAWEENGGKNPNETQDDPRLPPGFRGYKGRSRKLNVTQPLFYGGELQNTVKQAEENLLSAKAEYKKAYNDFIHTVRLAYYGAVKAEYNMQYQAELFEKVARVLKQVRQERDEKLVSEIDALSVESQYYQALYQAEAAKTDVLAANVAVRQALSLDIDDVVPVDLKMDFVKIGNPFNELLGRALENNADVRIKVFALEAARYGIEIYQAKKKPHFDLKGSYGYLGETYVDDEAQIFGKASVDVEPEWFLGVTGRMPVGPHSVEYEHIKRKFGPTVLALTGAEDWKDRVTMDLFNRFGDITDERTAEYAFLVAKSEYQETKHQVTLKLRDDYYSLQKYLIQIDSSVAKVRYQEKQNAILEYMLGLRETSPASYVENLIDQANNKYAFIQAVADYNTSLSSLSVSIGDPGYFDGQRLIAAERERKDAVQAA
jgi:outer membrane protein TolC